ncbi:MAG: tetratricopeptide repeat protein, partial [Longimicrobiales bacterium]|nr:tetratricopeptide repeat protein [Longimicrobiales bacterium]
MSVRTIIGTAFAVLLISASAALGQQTPEGLLQSGIYAEEVQGDLEQAIAIYRSILTDYPESRAVGAKAQLHIGLCLEVLGLNEARQAYQRVIADFPEHAAEVSVARTRLAEIQRSAAELNRTSTSVSREAANRATFKRFNFPNRLGWDAQLSPDGKSIALANPKELWIVPTSSNLGPGFPGTPRLLDTEGIKPMNVGFAWSGDGQWIAFNGEPVDMGGATDNAT